MFAANENTGLMNERALANVCKIEFRKLRFAKERRVLHILQTTAFRRLFRHIEKLDLHPGKKGVTSGCIVSWLVKHVQQ